MILLLTRSASRRLLHSPVEREAEEGRIGEHTCIAVSKSSWEEERKLWVATVWNVWKRNG